MVKRSTIINFGNVLSCSGKPHNVWYSYNLGKAVTDFHDNNPYSQFFVASQTRQIYSRKWMKKFQDEQNYLGKSVSEEKSDWIEGGGSQIMADNGQSVAMNKTGEELKYRLCSNKIAKKRKGHFYEDDQPLKKRARRESKNRHCKKRSKKMATKNLKVDTNDFVLFQNKRVFLWYDRIDDATKICNSISASSRGDVVKKRRIASLFTPTQRGGYRRNTSIDSEAKTPVTMENGSSNSMSASSRSDVIEKRWIPSFFTPTQRGGYGNTSIDSETETPVAMEDDSQQKSGAALDEKYNLGTENGSASSRSGVIGKRLIPSLFTPTQQGGHGNTSIDSETKTPVAMENGSEQKTGDALDEKTDSDTENGSNVMEEDMDCYDYDYYDNSDCKYYTCSSTSNYSSSFKATTDFFLKVKRFIFRRKKMEFLKAYRIKLK